MFVFKGYLGLGSGSQQVYQLVFITDLLYGYQKQHIRNHHTCRLRPQILPIMLIIVMFSATVNFKVLLVDFYYIGVLHFLSS